MKKNAAALLALFMMLSLFAGCQEKDREARQYFLVDDFAGQAIGILKDSSYEDAVKKEIENSQIKKYNSVEDAVKALKDHKVEALVVDASIKEELLEKDKDLALLLEPFQENKYVIPTYFHGTTVEEDLTLLVDATVSKLKGNNTYAQMVQKYFSGSRPSGNDAKIVYNQGTTDRVLNVGVAVDDSPFAYKDDSGNIVGFDVALANEIAKSYGATLVIKEYSKDQLLDVLKSGELQFGLARFTEKEMKGYEDPIRVLL